MQLWNFEVYVVRARSARISVISLKYFEYHCITHVYNHCITHEFENINRAFFHFFQATPQTDTTRSNTGTGYTISAGIARNKILAKLVSGKHKPDKQTLLPNHEVIQLLDQLPLQELNGFGGKLGDHLVSKHNIEHVGDLRKYSVTELMEMVRDVCELYHSETKKNHSNTL